MNIKELSPEIFYLNVKFFCIILQFNYDLKKNCGIKQIFIINSFNMNF